MSSNVAGKRKAPKRVCLCLGHTAADAAGVLERAPEGFELMTWAPGQTFLSNGPFDAVFDPSGVLGRVSPSQAYEVYLRMADGAEYL